jgi:hypothetical protein
MVCLTTYNAVVILFDDDSFGRWAAYCCCVIFLSGYCRCCGLNGITISYLFDFYIFSWLFS